MKLYRLLKTLVPVCLTLICLILWANFRSPDHQRVNFCRHAKPLTQIPVKNYNQHGVHLHQGTFTRKVFLDDKIELQVIIFPWALSPQTWSKVSSSSIQYLGKGGDDNWQEWLRPDYFYLLEVPSQATALAFSRLCYRNGDVEVESIKQIKQISPRKIIINDKISLAHSSSLSAINRYTVIVNTGSDRRDTLGTQTEVYFTTENLNFGN